MITGDEAPSEAMLSSPEGVQHDFLAMLDAHVPSPRQAAAEVLPPDADFASAPPASSSVEAVKQPELTSVSDVSLAQSLGELLSDSVGQTCVIFGPSGAGKTSLLATLDAACYADSPDHGGLSAVWDRRNDDADRLQREGRQWIAFDIPTSPTSSSTTYPLELTTRRITPLLRRSTMKVHQLRCIDLPGDQLCAPLVPLRNGTTSSTPTTPLLAPGRRNELTDATSLLLVVDATRPHSATLDASLAGVLDRLASSCPGEQPRQSLAARLLGRLGLRLERIAPRRTRLSVKRVLLLLSKVDVLAAAMADQHRCSTGEEVSALAIAQSLDPLGLALELLGLRCLMTLHRAIGTDADFAIGACSASGFCPESGEAFLRWSPGRSPDERLRTWTPFGVNDALHFLAFGTCAGGLHRVTDEDLAEDCHLPIEQHAFQGAN